MTTSGRGRGDEARAGAGAGDEESSDDSSCCHDHWRIALYYAYVELSPSEVQLHLEVQKQICEDLRLKGRIRISTEGVNGVVSGRLNALKKYEKRISIDIQRILSNELQGEGEVDNKKKRFFFSSATNYDDDDDDENENENGGDDDDETVVGLDIKYCQLRKELPIQEQLFDRLIVKETKTVISLFDQSFGQKQDNDQNGGCGRSSKTSRYRRRRERKREEQTRRMQNNQNNQCTQQCIIQDNDDNSNKNEHNNSNSNSNNNNNNDNNKDTMKLAEGNIPSTPTKLLNLQSLHKVVMEKPLQPARHLSATEWNNKLDEIESSDSALLLDVRNVYEMRVGLFVHPTTPTLLTNTRKYSDLPQLLASNEEIKKREQIFMYCTGGVRCERVSMLVHELYPDKEIYQLRGGIQTYLQTCSEEQKYQEIQQQQQQDSTDRKNENDNNTKSYFEGKNFVFDPRRTDPIHFGKIVGRCLVCDKPHDDYDNGHAPSKNSEARCNQCRMLVLICNDCRLKYRCHGEKEEVEGEDSNDKDSNCDESRNTNCRPLLYCTLDHCSHEGTLPDPELRMSIQNNK